MKKAFLIFLMPLALAANMGCSKKSSSSGGSSSNNLDCPSGSTFYMGYCVGSNGQPVGSGSGVAYQSKTASNTYYPNQAYSTAGSLSIVKWSTYIKLLKEGFGICDQGGNSPGCSTFTNFMVSLQATSTDANVARLTLEAYPPYNPYGPSYSATAPSWQQVGTCMLTSFFFGGCFVAPTQYQAQWYHSNVLPLNMALSKTNNNKGYELRSYGPTGTISYNKLIQLIVLDGDLKSSSVDFHLAYNGKEGGVFAQGKLVRCNTPSCGLWY